MPTKADLVQQIKQRYPYRATQAKSDDELVANWLKDHPNDAAHIDDLTAKETSFSPVALGLRVVPAAVGSAFGPVGGAVGAGAGESAAQLYEYLSQDEPFRPKQVAAQAAIGAIPFHGAAEGATALRAILEQGAKGMALGATSDLITRGADKELPSPTELALSAGAGAVMGGGTQAIMSKLAPKLAAPVAAAAEKKPISAEEIKTFIESTGNKVPTSTLGKRAESIAFVHQAKVPAEGEIVNPEHVLPSMQRFKKPEDQEALQAIIDTHGGFTEQRRGVQSFERQQALADQVKVPLAALTPGTALNAEELTAHANALASLMDERKPLAQKIAAGDASDAELFRFHALTLQATSVMQSYRGAVAEAGRSLGSLRNLAKISQMGDAGFIDALMKVPGMTDNLNEIAKLVVEAGDDPTKQLDLLKAYAGGTKLQKAQAIYYNNLLSGLKTFVRVNVAETFKTFTNIVTPLVGAPADMLHSAITGAPREVFAGETPRAIAATVAAFPKASSDAMFIMQHGFSPQLVERAVGGSFDLPRMEAPGGIVTNWPSRLISAAHQFYRTLGEQQELYAGAFAKARQEGLKTAPEIQARVANLLTGDGPESQLLFKRAKAYGTNAAFQETPWKFVTDMTRWKNDPTLPAGFRAVVTIIAPFMRTPANIIKQGLETSPVGFVMPAIKQGGREGAQAMGRAVLGSIAMIPLVNLAMSGRLSGNGPTNPALREELYGKGWMPNSVKIGNKWVNYQLLQPYSTPMAAVANAVEQFQQSDQSDKAAEESFALAMTAAGASILDQSFLSGINGLMSAISDPERFGARWLGTTAQGMVPFSGLMRNITQAVDPNVHKPGSVLEDVESIIPGLSKNVPSKLDRFGEPVERPEGFIPGAFGRGFLAPAVSTEKQDPVEALLESLDIHPGAPAGKLTRNGKAVPLTADQSQVLQQAIGQERKAMLTKQLDRKHPSKTAVEGNLTDITRSVGDRALALLRAGKPLTLEALAPRRLSKQQVDAAYSRYLESQKGQ